MTKAAFEKQKLGEKRAFWLRLLWNGLIVLGYVLATWGFFGLVKLLGSTPGWLRMTAWLWPYIIIIPIYIFIAMALLYIAVRVLVWFNKDYYDYHAIDSALKPKVFPASPEAAVASLKQRLASHKYLIGENTKSPLIIEASQLHNKQHYEDDFVYVYRFGQLGLADIKKIEGEISAKAGANKSMVAYVVLIAAKTEPDATGYVGYEVNTDHAKAQLVLLDFESKEYVFKRPAMFSVRTKSNPKPKKNEQFVFDSDNLYQLILGVSLKSLRKIYRKEHRASAKAAKAAAKAPVTKK